MAILREAMTHRLIGLILSQCVEDCHEINNGDIYMYILGYAAGLSVSHVIE